MCRWKRTVQDQEGIKTNMSQGRRGFQTENMNWKGNAEAFKGGMKMC